MEWSGVEWSGVEWRYSRSIVDGEYIVYSGRVSVLVESI